MDLMIPIGVNRLWSVPFRRIRTIFNKLHTAEPFDMIMTSKKPEQSQVAESWYLGTAALIFFQDGPSPHRC